MCIVCFVVEVQRCEGVREDPLRLCLVGACEVKLGAEVGQDRGCLVNQQGLAVYTFARDAQRGWCEGGRVTVGTGGGGVDEGGNCFDACVVLV